MTRPTLTVPRTLLLGAAAWVAAFTLCAREVAAQERIWTSDDTHRALDGASPLVDCVVRLESTYEPYAVGSQGEQGVVQLHPLGGMWPLFWQSTEWSPLPPEQRSPWNPWQSIAFLEWALEQGYGSHWAAWRLCS